MGWGASSQVVDSISMVKFEEHYDAENVKSVESVHLLAEYNAARTAFLAGDLDILLWADRGYQIFESEYTVVETELLALYCRIRPDKAL